MFPILIIGIILIALIACAPFLLLLVLFYPPLAIILALTKPYK